MEYTVTRNNNIFTIINTSANTLYVTVYVETYCGSEEWQEIIPEQTINTTLSITIPNRDNLYKLFITDKISLNDELKVPIYGKLLISFIEDVKYVLCGCPCENCEDCNKNKKDYLFSLVKMFAYNSINESLYNEYLTSTNDCIRCNILDINQCILLNETILGNSDNTLLMKQIIAYYYLVFYFVDLKINNNSETVTELYQYNEIVKCIKKLGIDINCIKENINNYIKEECNNQPKIETLCIDNPGDNNIFICVPSTGILDSTFSLKYTGGNGMSYPEQIINLQNSLEGLILTLQPGILTNDSGELIFKVTGTLQAPFPINDESGIYASEINVFGVSCCNEFKIYVGTDNC